VLGGAEHRPSDVGQRDPLNEYKSESFTLFEALLGRMRSDVIRQLMHIQVAAEAPPLVDPSPQQMRASHIDPLTGEEEIADAPSASGPRLVQRPRDAAVDPNNPQTWGKVQRNAPCPCGSGRKFKHCHGALV
jgi:preprotein translocase subunit SecA